MKISIITPSYNTGRFIDRAINSVLSQSYKNFEHIIIDGGSSDSTIDILKSYDHLKWISEPDKGQPDALNKGFDISSGQIIACLNTDDFFFEDAFIKVMSHFNNLVDLVMGNVLVKRDSEIKAKEWINNPKSDFIDMIRHWEPNSFCVNPVGYFYKRELHQKIGGFNIANHAHHDLEFLLEASIQGNIKKINHILGVFSHRIDNKTSITQNKPSSWNIKSRPFIDRLAEKQFSKDAYCRFVMDRKRGYQLRRKWTISEFIESGNVEGLIREDEIIFLPQTEAECLPNETFIEHSHPAANEDWVVIILTVEKLAGTKTSELLRKLQDNILPAQVYHVPILIEDNLDHLLSNFNGTQRTKALIGLSLMDLFRSVKIKLCWKFILLVRDPIEGCFASILEDNPERKLEEIKGKFVNSLQSRLEYFDSHIFGSTGIDIFNCDFDPKKGYTIIQNGNVEILICRYDKLSQTFSIAIEDFLGIANVNLPAKSMEADRSYLKNYKNIKDDIGINLELLNSVYASKFVKHFYSQTEIKTLYEKWEAQK